MFGYPRPMIPAGLLHTLFDIREGAGHYDEDNGGQWVQDKPSVEVPFQGVVMPINNEDWQNDVTGTYTVNSQKLYTNSHALRPGQQVRDTTDGTVYLVKQELQHNPVHPMRRYVIEAKGEAGNDGKCDGCKFYDSCTECDCQGPCKLSGTPGNPE